MPAARPLRPAQVALLFAVAAQFLFSLFVTRPHKLVFDEVHYVSAARALLWRTHLANPEHPPLAKALIAGGILLFGDNSLGWRIGSTLAGTLTILAVFWIAWLLFARLRTAVLATLFAGVNFTVYVQARIAMLDSYMAAFLLLGIAALLWSMRAETARQASRRWLLGSVLLGLAVGCKWTAAPYVAFAGIAFLATRLRDGGLDRRPLAEALGGWRQRHWPGLSAWRAMLTLGLVSVLTYLLCFLPTFLLRTDTVTLSTLLPLQRTMYALQTQVLPAHTYQSSWWSWPLDLRPIWYLYEPVDGAQRGILMLGNPAILWGGLLAVAACVYGWVRGENVKLLAVVLLWAASFLIWAAIPKSLGFFYYYYVPSILLCLPLAAAFGEFARPNLAGNGRRVHWDEAFATFAIGLFVFFYPILSAAALPAADSFKHWMWLPGWP
ncbi:phospholipid carrier-dependent glycosyltransferase [Sphingomonas aracearum]|uniref:Polyprenol-phosphate-mannose--protein mannosyltransferase n=1 Tax=Sphingomonas aracearum TaxID=2283317 RepID=A0A369VXG8_9SPHN|nr:phospholipid carrier-dependent glycosyltransferase [Sphingomonas aracearum]RDE05772.1 phospholipid carrier-dependent glycosyltransferase [Sphingomonas aracearum]